MQRGSWRLGLALVLVLGLALTGWFGVRIMSQANRIADAERRITAVVAQLQLRDFARVPEAVRGLAEHPRMKEQLSRKGLATVGLDHLLLLARLSAEAAIVYVIDESGVVVASSAGAGDSLVGQSYAFRPYFQKAMTEGTPQVYGAVGITTRRRGFYFSRPVLDSGRPRGVVVAKLDLEALDEQLARMDCPVFVESSDHVVFATNRTPYLYHATAKLSPTARQLVVNSRQFADFRLRPLPINLRDEQVVFEGRPHSVIRVPMEAAPGFSVVYLDPVRPYPLSKLQRHFVLGASVIVTLLGGLIVALLWSNHRRDLARERLLETEGHLTTTLSGLADAVVVTDRDGRVTNLNPKAIALTGVPSQEAFGMPVRELLGRDSIIPRSSDARHDGARRSGLLGEVEGVLVSRTGEEHRVIERVISLRSRMQTKVGAIHLFRDISEEAELRAQLQQAQKMEAIGRLAGGVAHDFNNLLMAISGNAELASARLGEHRISPLLSEIVNAAMRASELTKQLLTFSRKSALRTVPLNLHEVIREAQSLFVRGLDPRTHVEVALGATRSVAVGDSTQLQSALLNLFINARDAMPSGGTLRIHTRNSARVTKDGKNQEERLGIEISVQDSGIGIPEAIRQRIFEPFFTTKDEGHGTGLGLAAVYGCVKGHGGEVNVESREGHGATFRIWLPLSEELPVVEEIQSTSLSHSGGHWILADDDPQVRAFTEDAMELLGFQVSSCGSGAEAIELCRTLGSEVTGCIFDLKMPGPTGAPLLKAIRAIHSTLPVLFVSGYVDEQIEELLNEPRQAFLAKPYRLTELGDALDRLLANSASQLK